uniref:CD300 molecule like family member g n=1 Tax=Ictidomys tridecemlineatus TaxID=43179 RepID=A0A287D7H6_ICTTR
GPKDISGFEGDTVSLKCTYRKEERERKKYWCKQIGFLVHRCSSTIYSGEDGQVITQGRVSICDNPQELAFTVTLRDLTLQDAGKYWCGADKLGFDETFLVSLTVFPGNKLLSLPRPCCPPSPTLFLQPLSTASLQPQAKARQTQPPPERPAPPDLHLAVTTAKQGKTGTEASPVTGTVPLQHAGTTTHTGTSPYAGTSAHTATSPHAGSSRPPMPLDSTLAEDTSPVPISHSSRSRVSIPMVRILAPVLVLLSLLLAAGLIASGSLLLRWRKKAQLALETQKNEKVHLPTLVRTEADKSTSWDSCGAGDLLGSAHLCLPPDPRGRTTEELEAPSLDPMESTIPDPLPLMSEEELGFSKFISV